MNLKKCTTNGGCTSEQKEVTLDANWRWIHKKNDWHNCYTGDTWDKELCPDPVTCAENCAVEGVATSDWNSPYGVKSDGNEL